MNTNFNKFFFIFLLCMMFFVVKNVNAVGENTHMYILDNILNDTSYDSVNKQICLTNLAYCRQGAELADASVFYYYTSFKTYAAMHDWNFGVRLLQNATSDQEKACAIGAMAGHYSPDAVSHNKYIPKKIKKSNIPNSIIHPAVELSQDSAYFSTATAHVLDDAENMCLPLFNRVSGKDWTTETKILRTSLGGSSANFYDTAYGGSGKETLTNKMYGWMTKMMRPFVTGDDSKPYIDESIELGKKVLQGEIPALDPSGEEALKDADDSITFFNYIIVIIITIFWFWITRKWNWW